MYCDILETLRHLIDKSTKVSIVVGSAPGHSTEFLRNTVAAIKSYCVAEYQKTVAADGGADFLKKAGIKPDIIVGDRDSTNDINSCSDCNDIEEILFPCEKDYTDMHLAVNRCSEGCIVLLCATGGRADHFLGNIQLMELVGEESSYTKKVIIVDENNLLYYVGKNEKNTEFKILPEHYFSIIPITEKVEGLTIRNAKYLLNEATIFRGPGLTLSNCADDSGKDIVVEKETGAFVLAISCD